MSFNLNQAGDNIKTGVSSWTFNGDTAHAFEQHISKSVPGYEEGQSLIASYSDFFINLTPKRIYDLGCSTGVLLEKIESRHPSKEIKYIGIDLVPKMIEIAKKRNFINPERFKFDCKDILNVEFKEASIISSYYTLQFILPSVRQKLVDKIYHSLTWGGAFFVFEKTRGPDGRFQDMNTHVYNELFKRAGFKDIEYIYTNISFKGWICVK